MPCEVYSMLSIDSTFGPLGKCKVVDNEVGSILITKDSHLLLPLFLASALSNSNSSGQLISDGNTVLYHLYSELIKTCSHMGDGLHANMIITNSFVSGVLRSLVSTPFFRTQRRIRLLHSVEAIQHVFEEYGNEITTYMISCNAWHREDSISKWFQNICSQIALPSSNAMMTNSVLRMMVLCILRTSLDYDYANSLLTFLFCRMSGC